MKRFPPLLCAGLLVTLSLPASAQSCYVHSETSGAVPAPVVTEKCFEFQGIDAGDSMRWVCSDTEAVGNSRRELRDSCPGEYFGVCSAPMTPETLANEQSAGSQAKQETWPTQVPQDARIVTYHYHASDRAQAKIDCERAGGQWSR